MKRRGFTSGAHSALEKETAAAVSSGSKPSWSLRQQGGFTLIELLIVIGIIGILASVVLPRLNTARDRGDVSKAQLELKGIRSGIEILFADTGWYPNGDDSLCRTSLPADNEVDLGSAAAGLTSNGSNWFGWDGPYVPTAVDPWGTPYFLDEDYQCFASTTGCQDMTDVGQDSSVIVSCGPNAAMSNGSCAYDDDNIVSHICRR